jgi:hypothetical protein
MMLTTLDTEDISELKNYSYILANYYWGEKINQA